MSNSRWLNGNHIDVLVWSTCNLKMVWDHELIICSEVVFNEGLMHTIYFLEKSIWLHGGHFDDILLRFMVWFYGVERHFQQYFSYIVAVSSVGGENHRPVASHWQTLSNTPRHERGSNSQRWGWWPLIAHVVVNPTTIWPRRPLSCKWDVVWDHKVIF